MPRPSWRACGGVARSSAATRVEPEVLRAPIDGVISTAKAVAGQVVQAQDVLFQIVDPKGLWVEALVYNELDPAKIKDASAVASDGTPLTLTFQGFSRALQQQASVVQFAIVDPPPSISVGQPVTVVAKNGAPSRASSCRATRWCAAATARAWCGGTPIPSASRRGPCAPSRSTRRA